MYQALYRKYRPITFSDVVGQEHITNTLTGSLKAGKTSHAYLFTGTRGTGKTTCAKILSKAVNCLNPVNGDPCCECEICKGIDSGSILDVIEIDAASNNGVDNIRDLRDEANFTPVAGRYRVYIIDEVHMLSISAFNALLKTLEEPPSHVIFILATTEVHKLPSTILSRCQRFDFKRITPENIADRLMYIADAEGLVLDRDAAILIARIADGALRDALSILDQCTGKTKEINIDTVSECVGLANRKYIFEISKAISEEDCATALSTLDTLHNNSCDMERLCSELIEHFRNLMIVKTVKNYKNLIICTEAEINELTEISSSFKLENILYILSVFSSTLADLKKGQNRRVEMEMALVKLCSKKLDDSNSALLRRIAELEAKIVSGVTVQQTSQPIAKEPEPKAPENTKKPEAEHDVTTEKAPKTAPTDKPVANDSNSDALFDKWPEVLQELNSLDQPLVGFLKESTAYVRGEYLLIKALNPVFEQFISISSHYNALNEAVLRVKGKKYRLGIYKETQAPTQKQKDPLVDLAKKLNNI